jgi:hypothetical protein
VGAIRTLDDRPDPYVTMEEGQVFSMVDTNGIPNDDVRFGGYYMGYAIGDIDQPDDVRFGGDYSDG